LGKDRLGSHNHERLSSLFCFDEVLRRTFLKLKLMLPHTRRDRRPRLLLAAKALLETLKEASPLQHSFHISSALSLFSRVFCSILKKTPVTNSLLLNLLQGKVLNSFCRLASRRCQEASSMISTALYALQHTLVADRMSEHASLKMTPCIGSSLVGSVWRAWYSGRAVCFSLASS